MRHLWLIRFNSHRRIQTSVDEGSGGEESHICAYKLRSIIRSQVYLKLQISMLSSAICSCLRLLLRILFHVRLTMFGYLLTRSIIRVCAWTSEKGMEWQTGRAIADLDSQVLRAWAYALWILIPNLFFSLQADNFLISGCQYVSNRQARAFFPF